MKTFLIIISLCYSTLILAQNIKVKKDFYPNKSLKSELLYQDGKKESYLKTFYENGKVKSEGWMISGKKNEYWHFYFSDGSKNLRENIS